MADSFRFLEGPTLYWDGRALRGAATTRTVAVAVPARLVSFRREEFPPAAPTALKAAARMRGERAFAPLGPVAIEAMIEPPRGGRCGALMLALPRATIDAIHAAAKAQGRTVTAVRVAELLVPVPPGGLIEIEGEACLVAVNGGLVAAVAALGSPQAPGFAQRLMRERLQLGLTDDSPAGEHAGAELDFLHPTLNAALPVLQRPAVRLGLLAAGVALVVVLAIALVVVDAISERAAAQAAADNVGPLAKSLAAKRADMKEVASWFEGRPSLAPGLHVLAQALPALGSDDQVRLVRVRQAIGEEAVAEGVAADRAQMMAFLGRLRQDRRVAFAEIRAFRSPAKGSTEVVFELGFRLTDAGGASGGGLPANPQVNPPPGDTPPAAKGGPDAAS